MDEIHMHNNHIYRNIQNIVDLDAGRSTGYIRFEQIAGDTAITTVINKDTILKMVLKDGIQNKAKS